MVKEKELSKSGIQLPSEAELPIRLTRKAPREAAKLLSNPSPKGAA